MLLESDKLYYLSHPFTTFGDRQENLRKAINIESTLLYDHNITCINPIALPLGNDNDTAMKKCRQLYEACDAVILCPNWCNSTGCCQEYAWAIEDKKPIYTLIIYKGIFRTRYEFVKVA